MPIQLQSSVTVTGSAGQFTFPRIGGNQISITQTVQGGGGPGFLKLAADTPEAIPISELTAPGVGFIRNLDDVQTVQMGRMIAAAFEAFQDIKPLEEYPFRVPTGVAPYLKAVGGAANVQVVIFED